MEQIKHTNQEEHEQLLDEMQQYIEPVIVGIFWYDFLNEELLYPEGKPANEIGWPKRTTYDKVHKDIWNKKHYRAVAKKLTNLPEYLEKNYTKIPRGRIFIDSLDDNKFSVKVGNWINEGLTYKDNQHFDIDKEVLRALLICEFNLPEDFEFVIDSHEAVA